MFTDTYYDIKLHALAFRRKDTSPFPENPIFAPAQNKDLTVFKYIWGDTISSRVVFGDKAYSDFEYFNEQKILRVQKVRSTSESLVHTMGKSLSHLFI